MDSFVSQGKLVEYKVIEDKGEKVVINLVFKNDNDVIYSKNYIIVVYNRGTTNEQAFWMGHKPHELYGISNDTGIDSSIKNNILNDLEIKYGVVVFDSIVENPNNKTIFVIGYTKDSQDTAKLIKKQYLARIDDNGNYNIYEVVD